MGKKNPTKYLRSVTARHCFCVVMRADTDLTLCLPQ